MYQSDEFLIINLIYFKKHILHYIPIYYEIYILKFEVKNNILPLYYLYVGICNQHFLFYRSIYFHF